MRLGDLISALEKEPQDNHLRIVAPVAMRPKRLASYRGYYCDLAIVPEHTWEKTMVAEFLVELRAARGKVFTGYKGGEYRMDDDTQVWCAEHGEASSALVVGVSRDESTSYIDIRMNWVGER